MGGNVQKLVESDRVVRGVPQQSPTGGTRWTHSPTPHKADDCEPCPEVGKQLERVPRARRRQTGLDTVSAVARQRTVTRRESRPPASMGDAAQFST
jgi:hypothetical protein